MVGPCDGPVMRVAQKMQIPAILKSNNFMAAGPEHMLPDTGSGDLEIAHTH
jgi:hypothetical protein